MTVYKKNNAVGIDRPINELIDILDYYLNTKLKWGVYIYHKIYKNEQKKGVLPVPQAFKSGIDYQPIFVNDTINGEVGFIVDDTRIVNEGLVTVQVFVTFSLNIEKLGLESLSREDELVMMYAKKSLSDYYPDLLTTRIKNVYAGFNTDKIIYADMHPFINFSYRISLNYTDKC